MDVLLPCSPLFVILQKIELCINCRLLRFSDHHDLAGDWPVGGRSVRRRYSTKFYTGVLCPGVQPLTLYIQRYPFDITGQYYEEIAKKGNLSSSGSALYIKMRILEVFTPRPDLVAKLKEQKAFCNANIFYYPSA